MDDGYQTISAVGFDICRHGKKKFFFTEANDRETKGWLTIIADKETIYKMYRNDLCVLAMRNYLEGYKINKFFSGLLVYRGIVPLAERLSSKFHKCSLFIFWTILQPWVSPSDIPAAERGLPVFTNYVVDHGA